MDGFITRRPQRSLLNERSWQKTDTTIGHMRSDERQNVEVHTGDNEEALHVHSGHEVGLKESIGASLQAIDQDSSKAKEKTKKHRRKRRWAKVASLIIGLIVLVGIGFLVFKAWQISSRIFQGDLLGVFQQQELKMDKDGRSNVLILGSTDDMPGRDGANLTDSMMILSVDQKKKDAYMFSIPRDLYVQYGQPCLPGYSGKINAFYPCADEGTDKEAETRRMDATRKLVGEIFDMDIQYVAHINTVVIRDSVNAVGGITVDVQSDDPRGVLDSTFDELCRDSPGLCPRGHYLDFKNGPNDMNGDQAMAFSQARGMTSPTYGLSGSNFDREKNQQLVLVALKNKAASTGTLTDIGKVMGLMDALGDNLRTNIDAKEIRTIMKLGGEIKDESIHRLSFVDEDNPLMTTGVSSDGQSIVQPTAGLYRYNEIQAFVRNSIFATPVTKEKSAITVLNGGGVSGAAQTEADKLEKLGMNIVQVGNAPSGDYSKYSIYQIVPVGEKLATKAKLEELYSAKTIMGNPPFGLSVQTDFVVVIGAQGQ